MFLLTRTSPLFIFATLVVISEGVDYYNVHIEDNNRGGGIQVNLPKSGTNYFQPTEGYYSKGAPTNGQKSNRRQYERPAATNSNNGRDQNSYDESNTSSYPNSTEYRPPRKNTQVVNADGSLVQTIYREDKTITQVIGKDGSVYQNINRNPGQQPSASYPQENNGPHPQSAGSTHKVTVETDTPTQRPQSSQQKADQSSSKTAPEFENKKKWKPVRVRLGKVVSQCFCPNQ